MAEQHLQTSQDKHKLVTVRADQWEPMLVWVFREADTGGRIRPARLFLGQMSVGDLARRSQAGQVSAVRSKCDLMNKKEGMGSSLVPDY